MVSGYCCPNITQKKVFELVCLADWNCEASLLVAYEAVERVGCVVVAADFPGSEVSGRLLVLEEKIFRWHCHLAVVLYATVWKLLLNITGHLQKFDG